MFKRIWQSTLGVLGLSLIAIGQFTAIANWPPFFNQLNVVVITLIFILFFLGFRPALWSTLVVGFWLDIFSFNFFGLYLITFFLVIWAAETISVRWLTNRSLYSFLLLIIISTAAHNLIWRSLSYLSPDAPAGMFLFQKNFWLALAYQEIWSMMLAILLFNVSSLLVKRWQPFFLEKKTIL
jgi:cell shape-determining protein MreD